MHTEVDHQRLPGRAEDLARRLASTALVSMPEADVAELSALYEDLLERPFSEENEVLLLLTRPFSQRLNIPEYYRYTSLHVLDWFLSRRDDVFGGCLLAIHATLTELIKLERREAGRHSTVPEHIVERLRRLNPLLGKVTGMFVAPYDPVRGADLVASAADDVRLSRDMSILRRCGGFRRSDKHDEHVFIRSVLACEVTFFMIRWTARQAAEAVGVDRTAFLFRLGQLAACSDLLNEIFHMLRTLSPELFLTFRDDTGDASAVQSLNYHMMELVVYGYDERKSAIYLGLPHLNRIAQPRFREFRSLRDVVLTSGDAELTGAFTAVERTLRVWRGRHYGFGRTYLPDMEGSGGTEGAGYLKRFVEKNGLPSGGQVCDPTEALSRFAYC